MIDRNSDDQSKTQVLRARTGYMSIEINNVSKTFGSFAAVKNVSLNVPSGELVALAGAFRFRQNDTAANNRRT